METTRIVLALFNYCSTCYVGNLDSIDVRALSDRILPIIDHTICQHVTLPTMFEIHFI